MATLALSVAGQFVGGALGGPFGATVGRALGALAGSAVDAWLFGEKSSPSMPMADIRLQGSSEGGPIPKLYGWSRLSGNIIWATELEELSPETAGAKGTTDSEDETAIAANFAVAFCEGEVQRLGRVWVDGQLLDTTGLTLRFYRRNEEQLPDSLIEAKQGADKAPAYRGLCYIVFERLPLGQFGNRIPQISVELCRVVGDLEPAIRAVTIIPGATEFGYAPEPLVRVVGPGATANENTHLLPRQSDWTVSLDELQDLCPNLERVSLVVAWFGDDLRCGSCTAAPRVEAADRVIAGAEWSVAGLTRGAATVVSNSGGGPAYGGTPADAAVLAAIADLKARGLAVTLYPILLMDVPAESGLPDPYGWYQQPAYPWRGRITCDPAPGIAGSPDEGETAATQVAAFVGDGSGWDYRRFILHYADLAVEAGGVDALIIGSEMRGLTTVRGSGNSFPFVEALVELAADVRAVVGEDTKLTYAADWSEFSGYQPSGQKFFHLDPLWACSDIDAVGIDNYMPTADWRDGDDHLDAGYGSVYAQDYLRANIAGGEGHDWYYATEADRVAQVRTPITDGAYGEPWVWRFKDVRSWWIEEHYDRPGGVRGASPTAWVPESKPIWFTELGCGAVDKGANQPNVFLDQKSIESGRPYFSNGAPDPLMQRQFLRAHLEQWTDAAANPESSIYDGRMVDTGQIALWTWDARPYPAFPTQLSAWSDGVNYATGHWLTGRLGALASDELIAAVAADFDVPLGELEAAPPLLQGLVVSGQPTARDALEPVVTATGVTARDTPDGLDFLRLGTEAAVEIAADDLVATDGPLLSRRRPDPAETVAQLALSYQDRERGYLAGTVTASVAKAGLAAAEGIGLVLDVVAARLAAERLLQARNYEAATAEFALPPSQLALEPGDVVVASGIGDGPVAISDVRDGEARRIAARGLAPPSVPTLAADRQEPGGSPPMPAAMPIVLAGHLPGPPGTVSSRLLLAACGTPWAGRVTVIDNVTGATLATLRRSAAIGELTAPLGAGGPEDWDTVNELELQMFAGHLVSEDGATVLAGANRLAVEMDSGEWEVIGFAEAELLAPNHYLLTNLLRGRKGTEAAIGSASIGNRLVVLDGRVGSVDVPTSWLGSSHDLRFFAGRADETGIALNVDTGYGPVLPLPPGEISAERHPGSDDVSFTWVRRTRTEDNGWPAPGGAHDYLPESYVVTILDGGSPLRTLTVASPTAVYTAAQQTADFGSPPAAFDFTVAQVSVAFGPGHAAEGVFNA